MRSLGAYMPASARAHRRYDAHRDSRVIAGATAVRRNCHEPCARAHDPQSVLKAALARLKTGGLLHIAVPNIESWEAKLPGWVSYEPYHLLYFTPCTLRAAIERSGFHVVEIKTHESFSGWFLALIRTLLHYRGRSTTHSAGESSPPLVMEHCYRTAMAASGLVTLPIRLLQELVGRGDEIILLARAPDRER